MQVKVDGKRNITLDFEAPKKFKLLQDGKEIPYLRTGKNSFRLSRNIDGVLDLEEIIEQPKIVKPMQLQTQQMALVNPNDVLMINQAAQQLEVEQNILGETQKRVEQTQAYLDVQQQRINETILSVEGLETNNAERITATENGLFNLAGNLAKTEQNLIDGIEIVNNGLQEHKSAENPHRITKKTIGLDKVDNTSDLDKPISKAVQNALDEKADKDEIQAIRDELGEYQEKNDRFTNALSNYTGGLAGNQLPDGGLTGQVLGKRSDISGDVEWINSSASITIDDELSLTSKNPVQNKVITNKINSEVANLTTRVGNLETGKQDKLTQVQLDAINSGANTTNIGQIATNTSDIADINALIPNQATTSNQLADQGFVNSSIATNTAYFIGTFNSVAELEAYSGTLTNNDYAFVATRDTAGNTLYDRYKWNGSQWLFEYELNNSSFTANQWASINSNATAEKIAKIATNETAINNHIANKSNPHEVTKAQVGLDNVDNTSDLNKPISTATQTALNGKQATLVSGTNIKTINNQSLLGSGNINIQGGGAVNSVNGQTGTVVLTASDVGALPDSTVIPTEATVSGWGFTKNVGTVTRVNNVAPVNGNVSLSIPRVYNSTITLTQGGVPKGSFTLNQASGATIDFDAGGGGSSLPSQAGHAGEFLTTDGTDASWAKTPTGRNVGELVYSAMPLTDAGLHLLDGTLLSGGGIYEEFVQYVAGLVSSYPSLFTSESTWQSTVSANGVCGKFVYDSQNNTVRLPKITGIIEGTTSVSALGDLVAAGLPNITGTIGDTIEAKLDPTTGGAFYLTTTSSGGEGNGGYRYFGMGFDASRSNSIYGKSTTVQPQTIKQLVYIVVANSTKTEIESDIDQIATDLNGKADTDLTNLSNGLANTICKTKPSTSSTASSAKPAVVVQNYRSGKNWYRVYSDKWCEQGGYSSTATTTINLLKTYADTSYGIYSGQESSSTGGTYVVNFSTKTTSSFKSSGTQPFNWRTAGYVS